MPGNEGGAVFLNLNILQAEVECEDHKFMANLGYTVSSSSFWEKKEN